MVNTNYQYYQFEDKHIKDVQSIFWKAFQFKISETSLKNKYNTSFLGTTSVSTVAYDGSKPIAFYGAIPQEFSNGEHSFFAAHACDSYTLADYQKRGLHYALALKSYEIMQEHNFKMAYAFHSENTYHSTKKLKWKEHREMARFHIKMNQFPVGKLYNKIGLSNKLMNKAQLIFNSYVIDSYRNPFSKTEQIHQVYNKEFYNYKNGFNRHFLIKIDSCVFYLKLNSIVNVGFFDAPNSEELNKALEQLKEMIAKLGLNEILFQVDRCSNQYKILNKIATPQPSWLIGYVPFEENLTLDDFGFNFADLDTF